MIDCIMVFDGTDTDGSEWYRCTVHNMLVFGDAYVCEGYEPPAYKPGRGTRIKAWMKHVGRFAKALWKDERTPRWARWCLGISMIPTPFEIDEVIRLGVGIGLWIRHRPLLRELWQETLHLVA